MELKLHIHKNGSTLIRQLLIVPYGIETPVAANPDCFSLAFNRTLWN